MGLAKAEWIEVQERGWSAPDTHVCADCVKDSHLKDLVRKMASAYTCDYCGRHAVQAIAAEASVVIEAVYDTVHTYYGEPADAGVPYDGGFIIPPIDIVDVLGELGFDGHPDFLQAVIDAEANGNDFVPVADGHWAGSHPHEVLSSAWHLFSEAIKHETRFHFANTPRSGVASPYEIDVADVLPANRTDSHEQDQRGFVKGVGTMLLVGLPQGIDGMDGERRKLWIIGNGHGTASGVGNGPSLAPSSRLKLERFREYGLTRVASGGAKSLGHFRFLESDIFCRRN